MSLKESVNSALTDVRVAASSAAATTTTGMGTAFDWIPADIGKLGSLVGICLSGVLIYTHIKKGRADLKKTRLEIAALQADLGQ